MTPEDIAAMQAHDAEVDKEFRKLERQRANLTAKNIQLRADIAKLTAERDADRAEVVQLCQERLRLIAERDEARAGAISAAIAAITALQMTDAATVTGLEADEQACSSFCGHGRTCHSAEAHAAHNRALSALRALDGSGT